jgi:phospholipase/carboxylesterase
MGFQLMKYIYRPSQKPEAYTLLLLHGTGADETDLIPLADSFGRDYNLLSLRGNVSENGMPRFFRRLSMGVFDEEDLHFRTDEMVDFVKKLAQKEGFDSGKVIALGYSNGANIAGAALVKHPKFLAGAILFRPMQPFKEMPESGVNSIPVFFSSGKFDGTTDTEKTGAYVKTLESNGFAVSFYNMPSGHGLTQQDVDLAGNWLIDNFRA